MSMNANDHSSSSSAPSDPLDPGSYPGRVVVVANIGLQSQRPYQGEEKAPKHEFFVTYELIDEFVKDEDGYDDPEKPRWISERFSINPLSSENAKSTARYLALDPQNKYDGDWSKLIGTPCIVNITQTPSKKDKTRIYNNVRGVQSMRPKDAQNAAELVNEAVVFDFYDPDVKVFLAFPAFLQKIIKESLDYEGSDLEKRLADVSKSDTKEEKPEVKSVKQKVTKTKDEEEDDDWE